MLKRLRLRWQDVTDSLWFVPGSMILGAVLLALAMVSNSDIIDASVAARFPRVFGADATSSRDMLATIAGAMMTVAGVTFSITILAVAQASSQYTPRILRNFMRDRANQVTLGTLTGVFVYCLVVLRTIRGPNEESFVPSLAVLMAFVLALVAIGVLVYFIHHVATSLQASHILARVRDETIAAIDRLFPDGVGDPANEREYSLPPDDAWRAVLARKTGYITHVDGDTLLSAAAERGLLVRMEHGIGEHVIEGTRLVSVVGGTADHAADDKAIVRSFSIASFRTVPQDPAFGFRQMVDMAVKALSPGVNDTSTAVASVDAIGAALVRLANRRIEDRYRICDGELRVVAHGPTFTSLTHVAINEIRQNASSNVSILARLFETLETVARVTADRGRRELLLSHARRVLDASERSVPDAKDRADLQDAYASVQAAVRRDGSQPTRRPPPFGG